LIPEARETLQKCGKVLWLAHRKRTKEDVQIGFAPAFWNTLWTEGQAPHTLGMLCKPNHPVFRDFPTDYHSDWQWWELIHHSSYAMVLDGMPATLRPLVQPIDTWFEARRLGLLFEAKVDGGKLMVCSMVIQSDLNEKPGLPLERMPPVLSAPDSDLDEQCQLRLLGDIEHAIENIDLQFLARSETVRSGVFDQAFAKCCDRRITRFTF
jgi:hypothetical protein